MVAPLPVIHTLRDDFILLFVLTYELECENGKSIFTNAGQCVWRVVVL